jgi:hypothetical protein
MWRGVGLVVVVLTYLAVGLGLQQVYNENTTVIFNTVTEQAEMPWYFDRPWIGAIIFGAIPAAVFAFIAISLIETRFMLREVRLELSDVALQVQHSGYRLQAHLDAISDRLGSGPSD